jgi:hypothetical protein
MKSGRVASQKEKFAQDRAVIGVSVGSLAFENDKFKQILRMASAAKSVHIEVCDVLQRHTIKILHPSIDKDMLKFLAETNGKQWCDRNLPNAREILEEKLQSPVGRWQTWLNHPEYQNKCAQVTGLCDTHKDWQKALKDSIQTVKERMLKQMTDEPDKGNDLRTFFNIAPNDPIEANQSAIQLIEQQCRLYLIEETAIVMGLWGTKGYNSIIYPAKITPILRIAHEQWIQYSSLLIWKPVRLSDKPHSKSQTDGNLRCSFKTPLVAGLQSRVTIFNHKPQVPYPPQSLSPKHFCAHQVQQHAFSYLGFLPPNERSDFLLLVLQTLIESPSFPSKQVERSQEEIPEQPSNFVQPL